MSNSIRILASLLVVGTIFTTATPVLAQEGIGDADDRADNAAGADDETRR